MYPTKLVRHGGNGIFRYRRSQGQLPAGRPSVGNLGGAGSAPPSPPFVITSPKRLVLIGGTSFGGRETFTVVLAEVVNALAIKTGDGLLLRSRNNNEFSARYPAVTKVLGALPDETVVDGEIVATDESGRPSFNLLQNHTSSRSPVFYYVFDVLVLSGRSVMSEPFSVRREMLRRHVLPRLDEPIRYSVELNASLADLIASVRANGLEGLVAKRADSQYEPGLRSGAWRKMRINQARDFVIGGYTLGSKTFDALILGCYVGDQFTYVAKTRNGLTPAVREKLMKGFRALETSSCPFINLPEARSGRWGEGLTAEKMKDCRWLQPLLVGRIQFPSARARSAPGLLARNDPPSR